MISSDNDNLRNNKEKPDDWPQNQREANLSDILKATEKFMSDPNYKTKEVLFALVNLTDINEVCELGTMRIVNYEIAIINKLYLYATLISCDSIKIYLYGHIARYAQLHKMTCHVSNIMEEKREYYIKEYSHLARPLSLFYISYAMFNLEKNRTFADSIINAVKKIISNAEKEVVEHVAIGYVNMFRELSSFTSAKTLGILRFDKSELKKLFELESHLIKISNQDITKHPLRGVLNLTLSRWILKARNNYNDGVLYKCISDKSSNSALANSEVWMQKIEYLNDKREKKVIKELYKNKTWIKYSWAKNIIIDQNQSGYVCSYSKAAPSEVMKKKYGGNAFGYKSDRIGDVLAAILMPSPRPFLISAVAYDIIYSEKEAKEEINYLCELVDLFDISDLEKNELLNNVLKYWYLSFKDKKWEKEKERRYQLLIYEDDIGMDFNMDERFLKMKSTIFLYPDFIFASEKIKKKVAIFRANKLECMALSDYVFCNDCLQADFDSGALMTNDKNKCTICGSSNVEFVEISKKAHDIAAKYDA